MFLQYGLQQLVIFSAHGFLREHIAVLPFQGDVLFVSLNISEIFPFAAFFLIIDYDPEFRIGKPDFVKPAPFQFAEITPHLSSPAGYFINAHRKENDAKQEQEAHKIQDSGFFPGKIIPENKNNQQDGTYD